MGIHIEHMVWHNVWVPATQEQALLDAVAKPQRKTKNNPYPHHHARYKTIEKLCTEGPLYGIDVKRDGSRIWLGEDDNTRETLGHLDEILERIAPYVTDGGVIYMSAQGAHWKWVFHCGKLLDFNGRIVYEDDLPPGYDNGDHMWRMWFLPGKPPPDAVWFEVTL